MKKFIFVSCFAFALMCVAAGCEFQKQANGETQVDTINVDTIEVVDSIATDSVECDSI